MSKATSYVAYYVLWVPIAYTVGYPASWVGYAIGRAAVAKIPAAAESAATQVLKSYAQQVKKSEISVIKTTLRFFLAYFLSTICFNTSSFLLFIESMNIQCILKVCISLFVAALISLMPLNELSSKLHFHIKEYVIERYPHVDYIWASKKLYAIFVDPSLPNEIIKKIALSSLICLTIGALLIPEWLIYYVVQKTFWTVYTAILSKLFSFCFKKKVERMMRILIDRFLIKFFGLALLSTSSDDEAQIVNIDSEVEAVLLSCK